MEGLPAFLLAAVALAGSPGPATLSLTATGAAFGARRGAAYLAGIVVGMVAVMAIVASGVVGLLLAVPGATPVVTALAAAYFLYLAWRIATAPPLADDGVLADGDVTQNDAAAANRRSMFDQSWLDNPVGFRLKLAVGIGRLRVAVVDEHDLMAHEHAVFDGDSFTDEAVA